MGLLESIEEDERKLKELEGVNSESEEETQEPEEVKLEGDSAEEQSEPEEKEQEEDKQPEEEDVEEKPDNAAYARMRREKAAAEKRARELEERLRAQQEQPEDVSEQPNEEEVYLREVVEERKMNAAREHLASIEDDYRKSNPKYDAVVAEYAQAVAASYRVNNPRMPQHELVKAVEKQFIDKAASYYSQGLDPAEELYHDAVSLGFKGVQAQKEPEDPKEEKRKPSLDTIAKNKQRSAGMSGASHGTGAVQTKGAVLDMPLSEFSKIPSSELERIERG